MQVPRGLGGTATYPGGLQGVLAVNSARTGPRTTYEIVKTQRASRPLRKWGTGLQTRLETGLEAGPPHRDGLSQRTARPVRNRYGAALRAARKRHFAGSRGQGVGDSGTLLCVGTGAGAVTDLRRALVAR